ncbi:peptide/nickel transport system substrate-binding protein [Kribbella orskensis]|uniref:Peptide/nickel transport system substrate-binding protein n=1 Tax=Kribbella orskensis TaxID=2512216 RepID=A0ABY2BTL9_9ACTN|nr:MULTISPECIES: ABC transporter substrate-binding protein [Kribbella]TCN44605.1 peptide/nickel transport system substrate-binding protein [Kribbella sp. VKM Ac-2500]TCO31617.1 peptide/nickel transport system substrate-binding protein [Kribbella orskensis]
MASSTRRFATATIVAVVGLTLAACNAGNSGTAGAAGGGTTGNPVAGGTLNMLGAGDVDYMDPNISYYSVGYLNLRMWSRQLFTYPAEPGGKNTAPVADLATTIPTADNGGISADGKTYTIHIRPGAQWNTSPARQVTAADMVLGVKRTANPVQPFGGTPDFANLIVGYKAFADGFTKVAKTPAAIADYINKTPLPGVVAKDQTTVVFKLTQPATYFVDMLTLSAFSPAPVEVLKYLPASTELGNHFPSDGPYKVDSWVPTKSVNYSRNPAWNASTDPVRKAYVDKIVVNETTSQDSVQQQLQTGTPSADLEWDVAPPASQIPALQAKKDPNLNLGDTASSNPYVVYNTASPNNNKALANPKVRQALSFAINRDHILQVLGGPTLNPPLTHVLPDVIVGSKQIDPYPYNPDKAKQLLAEAGFPHLTLKFLYRNATEGSSKSFQTIQQDLSKVGITVVGVPSPNADFYVKYLQVPSVAQRGVWDVSLAGWGADWYGNAAVSFFNPLFSGQPSFPPVGSNFGLYNNPAANALIAQAVAAPTTDAAAALWAKADAQVMADAAFYPLTNNKQANYHASQVNNAVYIPSLQNFDPTNVWLTKDKQG